MKILRTLSVNKKGDKIEVICSDGKTRHLLKFNDRWRYLSHYDNGVPVYKLIDKEQ